MNGDKELIWKPYSEGLSSDFQDVQGGTTAEGIHAGVMAGTVLIALFAYAGLNIKGDYPRFNPSLPAGWRKLKFRFSFKENDYFCEVSNKKLRIKAYLQKGKTNKVQFRDTVHELKNKQWTDLK